MRTVRRTTLFGTPLVLAIIEWFHPRGGGQALFDAVIHQADWWLILHLVQVPLFALIAIAVWLLITGLRGPLATAARASAVCFAATIIAYDAVQGIATGILIRAARALPPTDQAPYRQAVTTLFSDPVAGNFSLLAVVVIASWALAVLAATAALARADAPLPAIILLAMTVVGPHNFPLGTLSMGCFLAAALWLEFVWTRPPAVPLTDAETPRSAESSLGGSALRS
jgi:predicted lysophospholipase L1 biosynthesis ABC-type transport system permease subunit